MKSTSRSTLRMRRSAVALSGVALFAIAGTGVAASTGPADPVLPPLDPAALQGAIAGLPDAETTGALLRITGGAGEWSGTSGVSDLGTGAPVSPESRFRIGSITKTFTAVVVLQLAAENRVDLDRTVEHYLPGLLPSGYPDITVRQLLDHTTGLPGIDLPSDPQWIVANRYTAFSPQEVLATATANPMLFPPGTAQKYSNTNYILAGMLVEAVTGRPYGAEVHERILRPLHMRGTSVPGDDPNLPRPHAHGYLDVGDGELVDMTRMNQSIPWAAGEMISTAEDLDRFIVALFRGELLPAKENELMFTLPDPSVKTFDGDGDPTNDQPAIYGQGLQAYPGDGFVAWGKTGMRYGYTNGVFATRDLERRVVYSVNSTTKQSDGQPAIVQRIAAAVMPPAAR